MQVRMANPAMSVPGAFDALTALASASGKWRTAGVHRRAGSLRASQINGCGVCVHMYAHDLKKMGESDDRIWVVAAWGWASSPMLSVLRWRLPTLLPGSATAQTRYPMRSSRKLQSSSRSQLWPH